MGEDSQAFTRLWERIHKDLQDLGRGFARIHETLGEDMPGFLRHWERIHKDLQGFMGILGYSWGFTRLWERIREDL